MNAHLSNLIDKALDFFYKLFIFEKEALEFLFIFIFVGL